MKWSTFSPAVNVKTNVLRNKEYRLVETPSPINGWGSAFKNIKFNTACFSTIFLDSVIVHSKMIFFWKLKVILGKHCMSPYCSSHAATGVLAWESLVCRVIVSRDLVTALVLFYAVLLKFVLFIILQWVSHDIGFPIGSHCTTFCWMGTWVHGIITFIERVKLQVSKSGKMVFDPDWVYPWFKFAWYSWKNISVALFDVILINPSWSTFCGCCLSTCLQCWLTFYLEK